jgi:hypothetical protein
MTSPGSSAPCLVLPGCTGDGGPPTARPKRRLDQRPAAGGSARSTRRSVWSVHAGDARNLVRTSRHAYGRSTRGHDRRDSEGVSKALPSNQAAGPSTAVRSGPPRRVFLVHGRDLEQRAALVALLQAFALRVIGCEEAAAATGQATPYTGDVIAAGMELANAAVVLLTPDDVGSVDPRLRLPADGRDELEPTGQPRLNVVSKPGWPWRWTATRWCSSRSDRFGPCPTPPA